MSRERTRPTREDTRQRLFRAAVKVFQSEGIAGASVEGICASAELTRGAFYSNFADKNELVMALIDDHVDRDMSEMERLFAQATSPIEFVTLIESPERRRDGPLGDPILLMEFMLFALRNPSNRSRLGEHQQRWRKVIATVVQADCDRLGVAPPIPVNEAAAMILALDNGYLLAELLEPGSYEPGTFARNITMLQSWFAATVRSTSKNTTPTRTTQKRNSPIGVGSKPSIPPDL
jgi:AcrR family transcriptional regulator